jgi:hypothetical protein
MLRRTDFKKLSILSLAFGGVALLAACNQGAGGACQADPVPGLNISVVDAAGNVGNVLNVKIVVRDGAWGDSITSNTRNVTNFLTAFDRPGTYAITVTGTAVKPFAITGVVVQQNGCHVRERDVTATMAP